MSKVLRRRIIDSPSPKDPAQHFPVVHLSILEKHSSVKLQSPLEKVSSVDFLFSADDAKSTGSFLFVDEAEVAGSGITFHLLDVVKLHESLSIYHVFAEQAMQLFGLQEGRRLWNFSLFHVGYSQQLAIVGAFGSHPQMFRTVKGQFFAIEVSFKKLKTFDQTLAIGGNRPPVEPSLNELCEHFTAKRAINNGSSLQKILVPCSHNDSPVPQHHHAFAMLYLLFDKSLVNEGVGAYCL